MVKVSFSGFTDEEKEERISEMRRGLEHERDRLSKKFNKMVKNLLIKGGK